MIKPSKKQKNFDETETSNFSVSKENIFFSSLRPFKKVKPLKRKGVKIQISGRLNGAEIARSLWSRKGRVPLQTLNATIDYSYKTALTIYGLIGIKVWVFRDESKPLLQGEIFFSPKNENPFFLPDKFTSQSSEINDIKND